MLAIIFHLLNTFLFGEEESDRQNPQELSIGKKQDDIEIVVRTI